MNFIPFNIGSIPIHGNLILAPMDGISDPPFRAITRRLGSALSISEFINTLEYAQHKDVHAHRLAFEPWERPFGVQLLDNDPVRMAEVARIIYERIQPDFFDLNLGCCVRRVTSRGAGAGLMRTPRLVGQIVIALKQTVDVPITVKMRLGWDDDNLNYLAIAHVVVESGGQMLALHGRTARMAYTGCARWEPITELKATFPHLPVIGNGDVRTPADATRMQTETGCDAVMVGRGALDNPWIFAGRDRADITPTEVYILMKEQLSAMLASYNNGALQAFRKFAKAYLAPYHLSPDILLPLLTCDKAETFLSILAQVFERLPN